ncbi:MAG: T9SS type A sorting domain-containing protein [Bacteroidetes bacterium]|nr:T9SS type A sorting domain-containing protein [Bacteroidota bacterium]
MKKLLLVLVFLICKIASAQNFSEILGRPTDSKVTMSIFFDQPADVYWEYGTSSGVYSQTTSTYTTAIDTPLEADFTGLNVDTRYFYRTRYRLAGSGSSYQAGAEHSFHTYRPLGSNFSFAVEADPHLDTNTTPAAYTLTLQNILASGSDFMVDLGDNFMSEKQPVVDQASITARHQLFRPYYGTACHSVPLYLALGNHEGELGWRNDGTDTCMPVLTTNTRKMYYPNPTPDGFYTGDTIPQNFVGLREDYYAWQWGNALFVVIDPYWYTQHKPDWGWTLGQEQYNWFRNVMSTSTAKFKFVFAHQLVGGNGNDGRGGTEFVDFFEMGGENSDSTWGFTTNRPGWADPIHSIMVNNQASIYFHGHDHFYGKQDKDGIVYQEVPQPSAKNITNVSGLQYGYVNGVLLPNRGYILVSMTDTTAKIDYVKTYLPNEEDATHHNGDISYSYTLSAPSTGIDENEASLSGSQLAQNYPNPFSGETVIDYKVGQSAHVELKVYDIYGKEVITLVDKFQSAGLYTVNLSMNQYAMASGMYYYKLTVGSYSKCRKMISF